jgi:hypothetical protein
MSFDCISTNDLREFIAVLREKTEGYSRPVETVVMDGDCYTMELASRLSHQQTLAAAMRELNLRQRIDADRVLYA